MIDEFVLFSIFDNFKGIKLDKRKLTKTIVKVSKLVMDLGDSLDQLDIHPIVFCGRNWVALDVKLMIVKQCAR